MAGPKPPFKVKHFSPTPVTWIVGALAVPLLIIGAATSGFSGFLIMAGLIALVTAIYTLVSGRKGWVKLPSRKVAAITLAASIVAMGVGGGIAGPKGAPTSDPDLVRSSVADPPHSSTPSASPAPEAVPFTVGDPGDPTTVVPATESASVVISDASVTDIGATALLATIPIKGRAPKTGYNRTVDFGTAWLDVDRNGCDTRNDILQRDLAPESKQGSCKVLSGVLADPYTGKTISFIRGQRTSALVQIDHVVALSNAWQTGAQQLTQAQRISLANDPLNLLAVDGRANSQKGDGDTATWLPSNKSFRCSYVAHQISVKATYGLWVTQAEHDAMVRVLSDCSGERALTSTFAPAPVVAPAPAPVVVAAPVPAPAPPAPARPAPAPPAPAPPAPAPAAPAPAPAPAGAYYANCTAVRAAGAAPLHAGQPGYSRKLDRDGDGIACE